MILLLRRRRIPLRARDIMTTPPVTIGPDASIKDVARKMRTERVGSVLVVDEEGKLRGIITERDLVFACSEGWNPEVKQAWEIMTEDPITAKPDEDIVTIIKKMRDANIRHIPVVDDNGKPLGMISARDILDFIMTLAGLGIFHEFPSE
ncbi:CBS domain protein [Pyrodictium delaneyi]|uniref:CBS domain protein n=1 Tax=Pyrodictium delaneyi TaxID=1273541 RepID=A0A0P0N545_9CREN|nr:CBS domain-containing protein [Pyrodictium delaneyi]ALL01614.1 CBS domain protein [Pyrodictium delaneyi]